MGGLGPGKSPPPPRRSLNESLVRGQAPPPFCLALTCVGRGPREVLNRSLIPARIHRVTLGRFPAIELATDRLDVPLRERAKTLPPLKGAAPFPT